MNYRILLFFVAIGIGAHTGCMTVSQNAPSTLYEKKFYGWRERIKQQSTADDLLKKEVVLLEEYDCSDKSYDNLKKWLKTRAFSPLLFAHIKIQRLIDRLVAFYQLPFCKGAMIRGIDSAKISKKTPSKNIRCAQQLLRVLSTVCVEGRKQHALLNAFINGVILSLPLGLFALCLKAPQPIPLLAKTTGLLGLGISLLSATATTYRFFNLQPLIVGRFMRGVINEQVVDW